MVSSEAAVALRIDGGSGRGAPAEPGPSDLGAHALRAAVDCSTGAGRAAGGLSAALVAVASDVAVGPGLLRFWPGNGRGQNCNRLLILYYKVKKILSREPLWREGIALPSSLLLVFLLFVIYHQIQSFSSI